MIQIIAIVGQICSGKSTYAAQYPEQIKKIDIGDVVRKITSTTDRTHSQSLDSLIIDEISREILYLRLPHTGIIIIGARQLTIIKYLRKVSIAMGAEFISVVLEVPLNILKARYSRRAAEKDLKLSFEDSIKRDDSLGLKELIDYLYRINTNTIQNYNQNEIDSLQEK